MQRYIPEEIRYYQSTESKYTVAKKATIDKYFVFIERALGLLNPSGLLGYIVPHKFFLTTGGKGLRKFITKNHQISRIIHFGVTQVFPERSTYTAILILQSNKMDEFEFKKIAKISAASLSSNDHIRKYQSNKYRADPWVFLSPETEEIFSRFEGDKYQRLGEITDITVGLQTSADKIYIFVPKDENTNTFTFDYKGQEYEIEKGICKPAIYDLSFSAFESIKGNAQMIFPYEIENDEAKLIDEVALEKGYPLAWRYLSDNKEVLEKRSLQGSNPKWYQFGRSQSLVKFLNTEKLVWSVLATRPPYVLDTNNLLFTGGGNGPYYGLLNKSSYSLLYFLAILSHPVIESMVKAGASEFRGSYYSHGKQFIEKLPIKKIDFSNEDEVEKYNEIVRKSRNLIDTTVKFKTEKNSTRKKVLDRKRNTLFSQLVKVINELYQISDKEFMTVLNDEMLTVAIGESE